MRKKVLLMFVDNFEKTFLNAQLMKKNFKFKIIFLKYLTLKKHWSTTMIGWINRQKELVFSWKKIRKLNFKWRKTNNRIDKGQGLESPFFYLDNVFSCIFFVFKLRSCKLCIRHNIVISFICMSMVAVFFIT